MKLSCKLSCILFTGLLMLSSNFSYGQNNITVTGKVTDQSGTPAVGVSVMLNSKTTVGTETDPEGNYSLNVPSESTLIFSCIGYETQNVPVRGRTVINIVMAEDSEFLEETVVIGYGVQKKSDVTGAIASVKSSDLENRTATDLAQALQGKQPVSRSSTRQERLVLHPTSRSEDIPQTAGHHLLL